jgi:hypothetical protein
MGARRDETSMTRPAEEEEERTCENPLLTWSQAAELRRPWRAWAASWKSGEGAGSGAGNAASAIYNLMAH